MNEYTRQRLLDLNKQFYQTFALEFSSTRTHIQPGVRHVLDRIPLQGDWMDVGCGNGTLAREWTRQQRAGTYTGVDFSPVLIAAARHSLEPIPSREGLRIRFLTADITNGEWWRGMEENKLDGALALAVLHHIPGAEGRRQIMAKLQAMIRPGGEFILSVWQFQNDPKWHSRTHSWEEVGLKREDVEEGDTLLDWKFAMPGKGEKMGLRYVHLFHSEELIDLSERVGFKFLHQYLSDGRGGRMGLYQVWSRP
jgi:tRNA (uracil-5-)-methyltransferase TRM9